MIGFKLKKEVPYMSEVYPVKSEKQKILPAITHVDGTGKTSNCKKTR